MPLYLLGKVFPKLSGSDSELLAVKFLTGKAICTSFWCRRLQQRIHESGVATTTIWEEDMHILHSVFSCCYCCFPFGAHFKLLLSYLYPASLTRAVSIPSTKSVRVLSSSKAYLRRFLWVSAEISTTSFLRAVFAGIDVGTSTAVADDTCVFFLIVTDIVTSLSRYSKCVV